MPDLNAIDLAGSAAIDAVAVDGSTLIAANSYLHADSHPADPEARSALKIVGDRFCNNLDLYYPMPSSGMEKPVPIFALWRENAQEVGNLKVQDSERSDLIDVLREPFTRFVFEQTRKIGRWLKFQFTAQACEQYVGGRNDPTELAEYVSVADALEPETLRALERSVPDELPEALRAAQKGFSTVRLGVAYAFEAFAKGVSYAGGLKDVQVHPAYEAHWLRRPALTTAGLVKFDEEDAAVPLFPWGTILQTVYDPSRPLHSAHDSAIRDVFSALREYTARRANQWIYRLTAAQVTPEKQEVIRQELTDFAWKGLDECGVVPELKYLLLPKALPIASDWLEGRIGKPATALLRGSFQAPFLRRAERWTRGYFRLPIRPAFEEPGISSAVDEFLNNVRNRRPNSV